MRQYQFLYFFMLLCLFIPGTVPDAQACLWDEDTLRMEAEGMPETTAVITGWFKRNPRRYYEMRLARSVEEIEKNPAALAAYDNAGVAADRLGRGEAALAWMERKQAQLQQMDPEAANTREHRYRYLANRGTFLVHQWLRQGAKLENVQLLAQSKKIIVQAIELNANAHFGREHYQLAAMTWLLQALGAKNTVDKPLPYNSLLTAVEGYPNRTNIQMWSAQDESTNPEILRAIKGVSGLIVLGNAWESIDIYYALAWSLADAGHASLAYLAKLRILELVKAGHHSLHPTGKKVKELRKALERNGTTNTKEIDNYYQSARIGAKKWQKRRWEFMEKQMAIGKHPDTHPDFWIGFQDTEPPLPAKSWSAGDVIIGFIILLVLAAGMDLRKKRLQERKNQSTEKKTGSVVERNFMDT